MLRKEDNLEEFLFSLFNIFIIVGVCLVSFVSL